MGFRITAGQVFVVPITTANNVVDPDEMPREVDFTDGVRGAYDQRRYTPWVFIAHGFKLMWRDVISYLQVLYRVWRDVISYLQVLYRVWRDVISYLQVLYR